MRITILTASDGNFSKIQPLLESIETQTFQPERIVILLYKNISQEEYELFSYYIQRLLWEEFYAKTTILSHLNSDHTPWQGHGYDRKFLLAHSSSPYLFMVDNDNEFWPEFLETTIQRYTRLEERLHRDLIIAPTVINKTTQTIQSQWIKKIFYAFPKMQFVTMDTQHRQEVQMMWGNALFWSRELFQSIDFDAPFSGTYEDIDFSYRAYLRWYPIVVINTLEIFHKETKDWPLEKRFVANPTIAYLRSRNRILFVKKNAKRYQKLLYCCLWLWIHSIGLAVLILRYWGSQRRALLDALWKWIVDGLTMKVGSKR